jgi:hypothetical protein
MKQQSQAHASGTPPAAPARDRAPSEPIRVLSAADLDQVSGGGGARGGVTADYHA